MKKEDLFEAMGEINSNFITEANKTMKTRNISIIKKLGAAAACLALVITVGSMALYGGNDTIKLSGTSKGVTVKYTESAQPNVIVGKLVGLSEEQLFTQYSSDIFRGTVLDIKNVEIDYSGTKEYRSIAEIQVDKVYRGELKNNDKITILIPGVIGGEAMREDTTTVSALKVGVTGVFMPVAHGEDSVRVVNDATLALSDVSDYGMVDGMRNMFLEAENGLVYAKWAYPGADGAQTLSDIEKYVIEMIENTK